MSAFICNTETIDAILTVYHAIGSAEAEQLHRAARDADAYDDEKHRTYARELRAEADADGELTKIGQMLVNANYLSVNTRYRENDPPEAYTFQALPFDALDEITLARTLGAVRCLNYQSCEFKEWPVSDAGKWLAEFQRTLEARLPKRHGRHLLPNDKPIARSIGWEIPNRSALLPDELAKEAG